MSSFSDSPLGRITPYPDRYDPRLLYAIERAAQRAAIGIGSKLPFTGADLWTAYELTWLDQRSMPQIALAELRIPASSPATVESKSLKLYFASFAQEKIASLPALSSTIQNDLSRTCDAAVSVSLIW